MATRQVTFLINANTKNFTKGIDTATKKFKRFGRDMQRMGRSMTQNISLPLIAMGGLAVKSATNFESSFADIRKTVDATEAQFSQMSKEIRALSKTVPTSVNELNKMAGVAGQLGVGTENIVQFTKTIAMLGDTTDVAGEQAALSLSRFMNVMGTAQGDIDRLGSTVVGLGNNFAAMESEIIETASSMAPLGNSVGLTEQQVLAYATTIAASGGKTEAASTAFQKASLTMKKAVIEGNKDLTVFAKTAGMTASEFQRAFQEDAGKAIQSFLVGLRGIQKEGGSTATVLEQVGLADQRLVREFGKVLGNLDDLDRSLALSNQEWEKNTALTDEAQKRYNTFNSRLKITFNRLNNLGITIGNILLPAVNKMLKAITNMIGNFEKLEREVKVRMLKIAALFTAGGPLLVGLGISAKVIAGFVTFVLSKFVLIAGVLVGTIGTAQWFVDNWELIFDRAEKAVKDFFNIKVPEIRFGGLLGDEVQKASEALSDIFGSQEARNRKAVFEDLMKGAADSVALLNGNMEIITGKVKEAAPQFTTFGESFRNAMGLAKDSMINLLDLDDRLDAFLSTLSGAFELPSSSDSSTLTKEQTTIERRQFDIQSPQGEGVLDSFGRSTERIRQELYGASFTMARFVESGRGIQNIITLGLEEAARSANRQAQAQAFATGIAHDFTQSFGQGLTNVIVAGEKLVDTLKNIGKLLASSILQKGIATLLTGGLGGDGFFGSGGGLFGRIFGVSDALITSAGDVVQFHPDDSILAMKDFSKLQTGSQHVTVSGEIHGTTIRLANERSERFFR